MKTYHSFNPMTGSYIQSPTLHEAVMESARICKEFGFGLDIFLRHTHFHPIKQETLNPDGSITTDENFQPHKIKALIEQELNRI